MEEMSMTPINHASFIQRDSVKMDLLAPIRIQILTARITQKTESVTGMTVPTDTERTVRSTTAVEDVTENQSVPSCIEAGRIPEKKTMEATQILMQMMKQLKS